MRVKSLCCPSRWVRLCKTLSQDGSVAYLEAEFFGGAGSQAQVLFRHGAMIGGPLLRWTPSIRRSGNSEEALHAVPAVPLRGRVR